MPFMSINGARLFYEERGAGAQSIVFIHGLMLASESYERQIEAFAGRYRLIRYDLRGQGRSEMTRENLDLESLTDDAAAVIKKLSDKPVHVVGFSMGAFIAMRLAARRPDLVRSLTLIGPSAEAEAPENMPRYARLMALIRLFGPRPFAGVLLKILFGDTYLTAAENAGEVRRWRRIISRLPRALARAAAASAHRKAIAGELPRISAPTMVVSGEEDRPISPEKSRAVHQLIRQSVFRSVPDTGHAVMIERPAAFNAMLGDFLAGVDGG